MEFTPSNFVMGRGNINGRKVVVGGDDFTVRGGAADAAIAQKQIMAEQLANLRYEDAQKQVDNQLDQSLGLIGSIDKNMRELII